MATIKELLQQASAQLETTTDSARLDAELILCHTLKKERSFLHTWPQQELDQNQQATFNTLLARRLEGEPVAHILGERGFWSLNLKVSADTLIPRPDTEKLVELALSVIPQDKPWQILDLGTGSGAIALSIAIERPHCHITATDRSASALEIARQNAALNHITNISFSESDWFSELEDQTFDMIVSNPPYIKESDPHLEQGDVRFEPVTALVSGKDGLDDIRRIIQQSPAHLKENGIILIEHGYDQAAAVCALLKESGFHSVEDFKDDGGNPRVAMAYHV